jgi:hypothetical protein
MTLNNRFLRKKIFLSMNFALLKRKSEEEISSAGEQLVSNRIYRLEWSSGSPLGEPFHSLSRFFHTMSSWNYQMPATPS